MNRKRLTVAENLEVEISPSREHEFLMTTAEVAIGYGVSGGTLRRHKMEHLDELIEGKHYLSSVQKLNVGCESGDYIPNKQTQPLLQLSRPRKLTTCNTRGARPRPGTI